MGCHSRRPSPLAHRSRGQPAHKDKQHDPNPILRAQICTIHNANTGTSMPHSSRISRLAPQQVSHGVRMAIPLRLLAINVGREPRNNSTAPLLVKKHSERGITV